MTAPQQSSSSVEFVLTADTLKPLGRPVSEIPFCILVGGDFSGKGHVHDDGEQRSPTNRHPVRVDRDNLPGLLGTLDVTIHSHALRHGAPPITLKLSEIDDFHPDRLAHQIEPLQQLSELRRRLTNPTTFAAAADEVRAWRQLPQPTGARSVAVDSPPPQIPLAHAPDSGLLDHILEQAPASLNDPGSTEWQSFLSSVIRPHLVTKEDPLEKDLVAQVDAAMEQILRTVLHHPSFQELETIWLGLAFLVNRLETDSTLQISLLDLPKSELSADLLGSNDLYATQLYRLLVQETVHTPGAHPWAVVAGVYTFDRTSEDVQILERIAHIAKEAGAPFLASASPGVVGCSSFGALPDPDDWQNPLAHPEKQQQWEQLRRMDHASYLGLSLPRFLLRQPFGRETEAISLFDFEEMAGVPGHDDYCWGNPIFAGLALLGQAFSEEGWHPRPGSVQDIDGVPVHVYQDGTGDTVTKPCAEACLTEQAAEHLLEAGLMPLLSYKNQDRIRLVRFQSIALPLKPLQGRWNEAG